MTITEQFIATVRDPDVVLGQPTQLALELLIARSVAGTKLGSVDTNDPDAARILKATASVDLPKDFDKSLSAIIEIASLISDEDGIEAANSALRSVALSIAKPSKGPAKR